MILGSVVIVFATGCAALFAVFEFFCVGVVCRGGGCDECGWRGRG